MPRTYPVLGYRTLAEAAEAMIAQGHSVDEIAEMVGRKPVQIRASLSSRAYAKSPRALVLPMALYQALGAPAIARGITVPELALQLLETIARDEVCDVLLEEPCGPQQDRGVPDA